MNVFLLPLLAAGASAASISYHTVNEANFVCDHGGNYDDTVFDEIDGSRKFATPEDMFGPDLGDLVGDTWNEESCAKLCAESHEMPGFSDSMPCVAFSWGDPSHNPQHNKCNVYYQCDPATNSDWGPSFTYGEVEDWIGCMEASASDYDPQATLQAVDQLDNLLCEFASCEDIPDKDQGGCIYRETGKYHAFHEYFGMDDCTNNGGEACEGAQGQADAWETSKEHAQSEMSLVEDVIADFEHQGYTSHQSDAELSQYRYDAESALTQLLDSPDNFETNAGTVTEMTDKIHKRLDQLKDAEDAQRQATVKGCLDENADNFNGDATEEDFDQWGNSVCVYSDCQKVPYGSGCMYSGAYSPFKPGFNADKCREYGGTPCEDGIEVTEVTGRGCMEQSAVDYDPQATEQAVDEWGNLFCEFASCEDIPDKEQGGCIYHDEKKYHAFHKYFGMDDCTTFGGEACEGADAGFTVTFSVSVSTGETLPKLLLEGRSPVDMYQIGTSNVWYAELRSNDYGFAYDTDYKYKFISDDDNHETVPERCGDGDGYRHTGSLPNLPDQGLGNKALVLPVTEYGACSTDIGDPYPELGYDGVRDFDHLTPYVNHDAPSTGPAPSESHFDPCATATHYPAWDGSDWVLAYYTQEDCKNLGGDFDNGLCSNPDGVSYSYLCGMALERGTNHPPVKLGNTKYTYSVIYADNGRQACTPTSGHVSGSGSYNPFDDMLSMEQAYCVGTVKSVNNVRSCTVHLKTYSFAEARDKLTELSDHLKMVIPMTKWSNDGTSGFESDAPLVDVFADVPDNLSDYTEFQKHPGDPHQVDKATAYWGGWPDIDVCRASCENDISEPLPHGQAPYEFLGCYKDTGSYPNRLHFKKAAHVENPKQQFYNIEECYEIAKEKGATFFGLQAYHYLGDNDQSRTRRAQCWFDARDSLRDGDLGEQVACETVVIGESRKSSSYMGGGMVNGIYRILN